MRSLASQFETGRDTILDTIQLWLGWWRDLMLIKEGCSDWTTNIDQKELLTRRDQSYTLAQIKAAMTSLTAALYQLRHNVNQRLALEVLMLDLTRGQSR